MGNMTLYIPDDLEKRMKQRSDMKWSAIAREAFEKRLDELDWLNSVLSKSEFTEEDAIRIGRKMKAGMARRIMEERKKGKN
jgi:hypothetical protein